MKYNQFMRVFDAVTDPIIGAIMDRTSTKWGKFRPFMVIGNVTMIVSSILMYFGTRIISEDLMWLRYVCFVLFYALYVIGYTFQTSVTRSGQTCLTNDPKQRPLFTIFNTIASLIGMGLVQFLAPLVTGGEYGSGEFFNIMVPLAIIISAVMTVLAIIGIVGKDPPEYFGICGDSGKQKVKVKVEEYVAILKENKELQRLMVAGAGCKLAFSIATNMTVLSMLYGSVMAIGLSKLPDGTTPYVEGMHLIVIILFCVVPMIAWIATLVAMQGYKLTGSRMKEIQAINAVRKNAIGNGMSMNEAMQKWKTIDEIPEFK